MEYKDPDDREIPLSNKEQFIITILLIVFALVLFYGLIITATKIAQFLYGILF